MRFHRKEKSISKRIRLARLKMKMQLQLNNQYRRMKTLRMRKWSLITTYQMRIRVIVVYLKKDNQAMLKNQTIL
jgi:hypothetical protein